MRVAKLFIAVGCIVALQFSFLPSAATAQDLEIENYMLIEKNRISRVEYDFTYTAQIRNNGPGCQNVKAALTSNSPYTTVISGELEFGDVASGDAVLSQNTFTIRQNRLYPFSWTNMNWAIDSEPDINTQTVDSAGGLLTFPNGVTLDIPPNAVAQPTDIQIMDLDCGILDQAIAAVAFQSHPKACLRGFSAKPDGLTFAVPVTATVPVRLLEPGEIPVQVMFDDNGQGLLIAPTDLAYRGDDGVIEIRNLQHFSYNWLATLFEFIEDNCRICETYGAIPEFCDAYAVDVWKNQQPGCCLLKNAERAKCAPGCYCCMQLLAEVQSSGVSATFGECEFLTADLSVTYPLCPDPTPQTFSETGSTPECPPDMTLDIDIQPTALGMYACEQKNLRDEFKVTMTGRRAGGEIVGNPINLLPLWQSDDKTIAEVSADDAVTAKMPGQTLLKAKVSQDPTMPSAQATLDVLSNFSSFTLDPNSLSLAVAEERLIQAEAIAAPGRPPVGLPPVDPGNVAWSSTNPGTADVLGPSGELNRVVGIDRGATSIIANFTYECETLQAIAPVTVECQPVTFTVDPAAVDLLVGGSHLLSVTAVDENGAFLDTTGVTWSSADESVVDLINLVGPQTAVQGIRPNSAAIPVTATYDDGCQTLEERTLVTVGCVDLGLSVTLGIVKVDAFLPIAVTAVDSSRNPVTIDENAIRWSSTNPNIAAVLPSIGSVTNVIGISPGTVTITAAFDEDTCGIRTATASIEVREDNSIAGLWHLSPVTGYEQCRYAVQEWYPEDDFSEFDVNINQPLGEDNSYITASYVPDVGALLTGNWDRDSGAFNLAIDTTSVDECGYLFYWDNGADLCGDAVNCKFVACQNTTTIEGYTSSEGEIMNAESNWYYSVTFSFEQGEGMPLGYNTWECEGNEIVSGLR